MKFIRPLSKWSEKELEDQITYNCHQIDSFPNRHIIARRTISAMTAELHKRAMLRNTTPVERIQIEQRQI